MRYTYRREVKIPQLTAVAAQHYDQLYQRTEGGTPIPWQLGMWFPTMAREEGVPRYKVQELVDSADRWMANFMMANQARWEHRNGNV